MRLERRENCHKALERTKEAREKQSLMYAKLKPLSPTKSPPRSKSSGEPGGSGERARGRSMAVAEETRASIDGFEARLRTMPVAADPNSNTGNVS